MYTIYKKKEKIKQSKTKDRKNFIHRSVNINKTKQKKKYLKKKEQANQMNEK